MRHYVLVNRTLALVLLTSRGVANVHVHVPSSRYLRGSHSSFAASPVRPVERRKRPHGPPTLALSGLINLKRAISTIGNKIQSETAKHWNDFSQDVGQEWSKFTCTLKKLLSKDGHRGVRNLDEVLKTFKSVLDGGEVDTVKLLRACRAHLLLIKSGGAALRIVAKDLEANLNKAEASLKKLPKEGKYLASLLEMERESGIHDGNMLKNESAAMGLLWIRRSLAFQLHLYSSLLPSNGGHPKDAAMDAYEKTLSPYHGWLLQKVFPLSLSQIPEREVFIAKFGGVEVHHVDDDYEKEIVKKLKTLVSIWEPLIKAWRNEFEILDLEDMRQV